jgi:hypothetical protein
MYKIALAGLSAGMFLAALAPATAVAKPTRHHPLYEGRSSYAPVYEDRSSSAPAITVPYSDRVGGCFETNSPTEAVKGVRHWRPAC